MCVSEVESVCLRVLVCVLLFRKHAAVLYSILGSKVYPHIT